VADAVALPIPAVDERRRTADRVFWVGFAVNGMLTAFWLYLVATQGQTPFFGTYRVDGRALGELIGFIVSFYVVLGFIWYGIKGLLLRFFVGFTEAEVREAFSSRMSKPFDLAGLLLRYSERRIRIADMIGRRGRFMLMGLPAFFAFYARTVSEPPAAVPILFLKDNLFVTVAGTWIFLAFYYLNGPLAAAFYGAQSRVMDGTLARANCVLITVLWTLFNFVMIPLGGQISKLYTPAQFGAVFALIWGSYMIGDTASEVVGSLIGKQRIKVLGVGDVNRKSLAGTFAGFGFCLLFGLWVVQANHLPPAWIGLAVAVSVANTLLELFSPRGTDDFTMATGNALICWAFGALVLA
jgi:dolichol kinase